MFLSTPTSQIPYYNLPSQIEILSIAGAPGVTLNSSMIPWNKWNFRELRIHGEVMPSLPNTISLLVKVWRK